MATIVPESIRLSQTYKAPCYHGPNVQWCWPCPCCQGHTLASYDEHATREDIAADARCVRCRKSGEPHADGGQP